VAKKASAYDAIIAASSFGISVLEAGQAEVAAQFARHGIDRFAGVALRAGARVPLIEGALAQLACTRHALHDAGDHTIVLGAVVEAHCEAGDPLLHYARTFGSFAASVPNP
jgi:flavin reductase (DIM6/NTAB) family NADH-FMN oxidoreductase RutF